MSSSIPSKPLQVSLCQMTSIDDQKVNVAQMADLLNKAMQGGTPDLVLFPENSLYLRLEGSPQPLNWQAPFLKEYQQICNSHGMMILMGVVSEGTGTKFQNSILKISPGEEPQIVYSKIHLFDVDVEGAPAVRESAEFEYGSAPAIIEIKGWKIGLSICYDIRFPELYWRYATQGTHAVIIPAAFLVPTGKAHWEVLLRARAIESQNYVLAAAQSGEHLGRSGKRRETYGHSMVVDPWGQILGELQKPGPGHLKCELSPERLNWVRSQIPMHQHRRLE